MTRTTMKTLVWGVLIASGSGATAKEIDFNRDIRPILSDRCYHCHGPDAENQKSDFRVDTFEQITADLGGYAGVVPGQPENSTLLKRLHSTDPDDVMPPLDSNRVVSDEEKALLKEWIKQGAEYAEHWAFVAPTRAALPKESATTHPVDAFVLARLAKEKLAFRKTADRPALTRRVALILTGLPASPEEVSAFVNDTQAGAYERMVDRYLASPHYAERMTAAWLDVARFADTDGYQNDGERSNWPWRDWVITAFDQNMPFDEFTIKQIAGDLLPDPTPEDVLATALIAITGRTPKGARWLLSFLWRTSSTGSRPRERLGWG